MANFNSLINMDNHKAISGFVQIKVTEDAAVEEYIPSMPPSTRPRSSSNLQFLPKLSIPSKSGSHCSNTGFTSSSDVSPATAESTSTPETPASLPSPVVKLVDLTGSVKTMYDAPVTNGGYSDIYVGKWQRTQNCTVKVALKVLRRINMKDQNGLKARKTLNREVYIWHRLDHPNIVELFGTSYHIGNVMCMVMRWYENGNAVQYLQKNPTAGRTMLLLDIARGLNYLHSSLPPIVHGDLKGNNILVNDEGHAVLADFGISQVIDNLIGPTGLTPSHSEVGALRWQAPEIVEHDTLRPSFPSDVWGFGCTAYELLSGHFPYHFRHKEWSVIDDIKNGVKPWGQDGDHSLTSSPDMRRMLNDCWKADPTMRPSAGEVEEALAAMHMD